MAQVTPIRGFTNTPVSRSIIIVTTLLALATSILLLKPYAKLAIDPFIIQYGQYWRIATFQMAVVNESDYLLCVLLWFHFKVLERHYGSHKYLSLAVLFCLYNAAITFLVLTVGQLMTVAILALFRMLVFREPFQLTYFDTFLNLVASGPVGILSSLYVCFGASIPVSYRFKIVISKPTETSPEGHTLTFSNHFQIHTVYLLLMFNNGIRSLIPALVGLFIGNLYTRDLLIGSDVWRVPLVVFRLFVNPRKFRRSAARYARQRWLGYLALQTQPSAVNVEQGDETNTPERYEEDDEVAINDIPDAESRQPQGEPANPVRPLGRQFLDTFRT